MPIRLYAYWRSSASWRVRIALAWKELPYEVVPVNLRPDGSEQHSAAYRALNPQGLVPLLIDDEGAIAQSVAICEYLEERHPQPPLLPRDPRARAQVRALVQAIACDIHPLDNLRVLQYLRHSLRHDQAQVDAWYRHWIALGFAALETELQRADASHYACYGQLSMADVFLVPQVANARRLSLDLAPYPRIVSIDAHLAGLPAFAQSLPERQPDYVPG